MSILVFNASMDTSTDSFASLYHVVWRFASATRVMGGGATVYLISHHTPRSFGMIFDEITLKLSIMAPDSGFWYAVRRRRHRTKPTDGMEIICTVAHDKLPSSTS
jgi:hypothetical protein